MGDKNRANFVIQIKTVDSTSVYAVNKRWAELILLYGCQQIALKIIFLDNNGRYII